MKKIVHGGLKIKPFRVARLDRARDVINKRKKDIKVNTKFLKFSYIIFFLLFFYHNLSILQTFSE